jgi:hypothetical protein
MAPNNSQTLIIEKNVGEFFQGLVTEAVTNQQVETSEETVYYLVNLLTSFTRTKALYEKTSDGLMLRPLALLYGEALEAPSHEERNQALKRLGDVALFISGVFADSLNRKLVDVDYYIAMGGNAYSYLSDSSRNTLRWQVLSEVFEELASKFAVFVDILGEVSENAHFNRDVDVMRLYEVWLRTGSKRAGRRLQRLGIQPLHASVSRRQH